ncbi:MAG: HEAT repeat domain-containing protein [Planctomycetota bacterium]
MLRSAHHAASVAAFAGFASLGGSCAINAEPDFDSAVPQDRFLAIRQAQRTQDQSATPDLIRQLGSDDALVRLAAADALEEITGLTHGFDSVAAESERAAAIDRWVQWLDARGPEDAGRTSERVP